MSSKQEYIQDEYPTKNSSATAPPYQPQPEYHEQGMAPPPYHQTPPSQHAYPPLPQQQPYPNHQQMPQYPSPQYNVNVVYSPPCKPAPAPRSNSSGLFGSTLGGMFDSALGTLNGVARKIDHEVSVLHAGDLFRIYFVTGNDLQIISRETGRCLQIIMDPHTNSLTVDFNGITEAMAFNSVWRVHVENGMHVQLYNQDNYLAAVNKSLVLLKAPYPTAAPVATKFLIRQLGNYVGLESVQFMGFFVTKVSTAALLRKEYLSNCCTNFYIRVMRR